MEHEMDRWISAASAVMQVVRHTIMVRTAEPMAISSGYQKKEWGCGHMAESNILCRVPGPGHKIRSSDIQTYTRGVDRNT